ncbi:MAG TPA: hypothetical protein VMT18_03165 [Planctomycetota bacterium]|nr:hypothetical protein [Planctomycetota bacterium]
MERDEELARCLWPWLSERLARVGDDVLELERRLERGEPCSATFERLRERTEGFGWLLGCVAEALDGAPASQRRAPLGLAWMVEALCEVGRERGRPLLAQRPEPARPGVTRAQTWACARVLWRLGEEFPRRALSVRAQGDGWVIEDGLGGRWTARQVSA